ncbi:MAG TPA: VCBS repeat-containing protein, partial [Nitrospirae bacterium]|nr:VCBS repeat-containing protein [Nitrospirota bacterium]HEW81017.1 VCBS repeat-containing protein [Nitrospirota bacterium]
NKARDAVLGYFIPVSGTVEGVAGETVRVRLEGDRDIPVKARLTVFKEGEPFYHPVTNEKIGNTEFLAGRIEIKEKGDGGLYIAGLKSGKAETGDKVRLASSRIKLAFFQDRKSDWALSERFYNGLKESGRFEILESYTPSYEPEKLSKLARDLGAEAVLLFSTPVRDEKKTMNIKLFWSEDTEMFAEIEETLDREIGMAVPGDEFLSVDLIDREPWGTYNIEDGSMIAMGDINNNGELEFVVSDGNDIRIYSQKRDMREEWLVEGAPSERHLSIDVLDMNNNGYAEIFVTSLINNKEIRSFVLEYDPSGVVEKIKTDIPYFLRVSGNKLLMQDSGYINKFSGPVYEGIFQDGEYRPGTPLNLPKGVNIYGFTRIDWQESGKNHLLTFDDKGFMHLYDEAGNSIWNSGESYGKSDITVKRTNMVPGDPSEEWVVRERLITIKTDRGQEVFVVKKIPKVAIVPGFGYKEAEVYSLWWDGAAMEIKPILKGLPGSVNDFWIAGKRIFLIVRGNVFALLKNFVSGEFSKGSMIYYYNIKSK